MKRVSAVILLAFSAMLWGATAQPSIDHEQQLIDELKIYQTDFIARFSGSETYAENKKLKGRSSSNHRMIARKILQEEIEQIGFESVEHNYKFQIENTPGRIKRYIYGVNVMFTVPSTSEQPSKKQLIMVAHYDAFGKSPGADDNASGVSAVLGAVKIIKKLPNRDLDVLVIFSDQEELGLIGSYKFVEKLKGTDIDVHSVHAFDMLGWDGDGDRAVELDPGSDVIEELYLSHALKLGIPVTIVESNRSDHAAFRAEGFPSSLLIEEAEHGDFNPYYHSRKDRIENIDFDYLANHRIAHRICAN